MTEHRLCDSFFKREHKQTVQYTMYLSLGQESLFAKYTKILIVVAAYW